MSRLSSYLIALMAAVVLALVPALTPAAEAAPGAPAKSLKALGSVKVNSKLNAKPGSWTKGTKFTYRWYLNGKAVKGGTNKTLKMTPSRVGMKASVKVTGKLKGHTTVSRTSKATAAISYPSRTAPSSRTSCPSWAPIKGNQPSMIYHLKGQRFYTKTHPEECFRTESAAKKAGYRKAKI